MTAIPTSTTRKQLTSAVTTMEFGVSANDFVTIETLVESGTMGTITLKSKKGPSNTYSDLRTDQGGTVSAITFTDATGESKGIDLGPGTYQLVLSAGTNPVVDVSIRGDYISSVS